MIRSSFGGEIEGPIIPGFKRGDKITYSVNGAKTHITSFLHRGTLYNEIMTTVKQKLFNTPSPTEETDDWATNWLFFDPADYGYVI